VEKGLQKENICGEGGIGLTPVSEGETFALEGVEEILDDTRWLLHILTEEIPNRTSSIRSLLQCFLRIQELEARIAAFTTNLEEQEAALALAMEEKRNQEMISEELARQLEELNQNMKMEQERFQCELSTVSRERDQYAQDILELKEELKRRNEVLVDLSGVKRALQKIIHTLQGKKDDSSLHN